MTFCNQSVIDYSIISHQALRLPKCNGSDGTFGLCLGLGWEEYHSFSI